MTSPPVESSQPTVSSNATPSPSVAGLTTSAPTDCTGSTPNWVDADGDGCDFYEANDRPGCPFYGAEYEGDMGVANDNCCYCFGTGSPTVTPAPTTPAPTPDPTNSLPPNTPRPTYCTGNTEGWTDEFGDDCSWYEDKDEPGCPNYGVDFPGELGTAKDNCCYCAGTAAPTSSP